MTRRERMAGADAAWLHMERRTNRMAIHCVVWFDAPVDWAAVTERVRVRLVAPYRRFRQRVEEPLVPLGVVAVPHWVDDPDFELENHIRRVTLPAPGDTGTLHRYVAKQVPRALDRTRPLWELHFIDGYRGGGALLVRLHHAVADGIALMQLLESLSDEGAAAAAPAPRGRASSANPAWGVDVAALVRASASSLWKMALVRQDRRTVLRGKLGTVKTVTWCEPVPLDAVKAVGKRTGGSVNDVLLAVIAGALRRYLIAHDSLVDEIGAVVPLNIRPLDVPVPPELGNEFGLVFPALPIGIADPDDRIAAVKRAMDSVKLSRQGLLTFTWLSAVGLIPAQLEKALIDLYAGMGSVIITNVAGPRQPLSVAGTPAAGLLFWVPTSGPIGVGLSIVSYAGRVTLGLVVDARLVPDSESLRDALEAELDTFRGGAAELVAARG